MSDMIEQLACYKRCTKVALDWVWSNSSQSRRNTRQAFHTTAKIVVAAENIRAAGKQVPGYVVTALRDAIRYRWRLHSAFAAADAGSKAEEVRARDDRHKVFIMRLQKTLDMLLPLEDKSPAAMMHCKHEQVRQFTRNDQSNRFQSLSEVEDRGAGHVHVDAIQTDVVEPAEPGISETIQLPWAIEDMVLKDDEFAEYCSLSILMNELDTLLETTNTYWAEAADGGMPIPVAAWLSTTVFHAVARIFTRYSTIAPSYDVLMEKWFKHREIWPWRIRFRDIPALSKEEGPCWDGIALWYYGKLLSDCRTQKEYEKIVPTAGSRQTPQMLIPNPATTSYRDVAEYDNAMDKMQESMRLGLVEKRGIRKLEPAGALQYVCEPLLPVLASALANKNDPVPFHLVFGYEMLLSSFKTHLWRNPRQNCRLAALRLAMEVKSEAEKAADPALFNCKCTAKNCILCTMQWGLADTASRLDAYVREVRFDLYYQAPWTAGCHMVETLVFARYEGLNLCLSSGIVAALLHLYNALVHVSPAMPRVKLLDDFCALFKEQVFLGTLPMDNFSSHFRRAMGGKLSKPGSEDGPSSPSSSRIALPTKAQLTHAIKPGSSLFYDMHNFSFAPTPAIWTRAYLGPGTAATSAKKQRDVLDLVHTAPFNVPLGKLGDAVMSEFTGSQPMMRINYFAIHSFCARVMRALDEALLYGSKVHGVHIVDDLLGGIMRHLGDDGARRVLRFWGPMVCVKRVFGEVDGQRGMEGFLWRV